MTDTIAASNNFIATFMWFTPSPLFIFVNLVIGTIALVSRFAAVTAPKTHQTHNLSHCNHHHNEQTFVTQPEPESTQPQLAPSLKPSLLQRVLSFNLNKHEPAQTEPKTPPIELVKSDPIHDCDSDDEENSKPMMKKSASEKECSMARSESTTSKEEDEADDAKADDFINMFKKQLRLQRLNSFIRSKNSI
ncbi:hypothetical protein MtrunA17_Chr4g0071131 [Medicago truncatula]|uniref:DUF4408 domain protein n=1 Tax=Medicago truncatula TaxID=3880 RepID=I3SL07_MEDTR|nr:pathogen-associated molecular patterns-induced protein A70 [Medicago truncatula]AFK40949.1 unknown [Medicago truncatula]KEH32515.1 DUF4408 domain protein [Medicago truncatula]RHN64630.1 hypothetical protein MtrunA17_Chr4g0071131 [Medicago truncatula]